MLSCSCPEWDGDPDQWWFFPPEDFEKFKGKRRKRCCSCNELIDIGAACIALQRFRCPRNDIEEQILGDEVQMASLYMCELCGEHFLNLSAIGYCLDPTVDMRVYLKEYQEMTGFYGQY